MIRSIEAKKSLFYPEDWDMLSKELDLRAKHSSPQKVISNLMIVGLKYLTVQICLCLSQVVLSVCLAHYQNYSVIYMYVFQHLLHKVDSSYHTFLHSNLYSTQDVPNHNNISVVGCCRCTWFQILYFKPKMDIKLLQSFVWHISVLLPTVSKDVNDMILLSSKVIIYWIVYLYADKEVNP